MDFSTAEGRGKSSNRQSVNSMLRRFIPKSKHRGTSTCGNEIIVCALPWPSPYLRMFGWLSLFMSCTSLSMLVRFERCLFILSTITFPVDLCVT